MLEAQWRPSSGPVLTCFNTIIANKHHGQALFGNTKQNTFPITSDHATITSAVTFHDGTNWKSQLSVFCCGASNLNIWQNMRVQSDLHVSVVINTYFPVICSSGGKRMKCIFQASARETLIHAWCSAGLGGSRIHCQYWTSGSNYYLR